MSTFYSFYPPSGGGSSSNASVSTNGTPIPGSSTLVAGENPSGNQQPLQTNAAGSLLTAPDPTSTGNVNVTQFGSNNVVTGAGTSGLGIPRVTVSSDSSLFLQTGTNTIGSINNILGTISLPTGASTAILQSNVQSAPGTPQTVALTIQGNSSGIAIPVSASALPLPTGAATSSLQTAGNASLTLIQTQTANLPASLGQKLMAASFPIAIALDQSAIPVSVSSGRADVAPATQNITVVDSGSTTTAQANGQSIITGTATAGSFASFSVSSENSIEILVSGTWTSTLSNEVSFDGGVSWFTRGVKQTGSSYIASTFTQNYQASGNITGVTNVRVRATAAVTGMATVKVILSANPYVAIVTNPLTLRDATVQSIQNTIKPASTAALATDTALVVGLSPNSNKVSTTNVTTYSTATFTAGAGATNFDTDCSLGITTITFALNSSGVWGGTVQFFGSLDGTTFIPWAVTNLNALDGQVPISTSYVTSQVPFVTNVAGLKTFRITGNVTSFNVSPVMGIVTGVSQISQIQSVTFTSDLKVAAITGTVAAGTAAANSALVGMVYNATTPAPTTGQQLALQSDVRGNLLTAMSDVLSTGTITTQNLAPTATATAGSAVVISPNSVGTVTFQVNGVYSGALSVQVTVNNGTWFTLGGASIYSVTANTFASVIPSAGNGVFSVSAAGVQGMRITALGAVTGTATITVRAAPAAAITTNPVSAISGSLTSVTTVSAVTQSNQGGPTAVADVASAALVTTTTTAAFTPGAGQSFQIDIPVTAVSGSGTLVVAVQESLDSGTNWITTYTFPAITATGSYFSPPMIAQGNRVRYVQTLAGITSITRAINRLQSSNVTVIQALPGTLTDRSGTIASGSVSQQVAAANPGRKYFAIQNLSSTATMFINFTSAASLTSASFALLPYASWGMEASFVTTEAINIISTTAAAAYAAKEG